MDRLSQLLLWTWHTANKQLVLLWILTDTVHQFKPGLNNNHIGNIQLQNRQMWIGIIAHVMKVMKENVETRLNDTHYRLSSRKTMMMQLSNKHKCSTSGQNANESVQHDLLLNHHHPAESLWGLVEWHLKHFPLPTWNTSIQMITQESPCQERLSLTFTDARRVERDRIAESTGQLNYWAASTGGYMTWLQ